MNVFVNVLCRDALLLACAAQFIVQSRLLAHRIIYGDLCNEIHMYVHMDAMVLWTHKNEEIGNRKEI